MSDVPPDDGDDAVRLKAPRLTWQERLDARSSVGVPLDPTVEALDAVPAYTTRYLPDRLLVTKPERLTEITGRLQDAASEFGWSVVENRVAGQEQDAASRAATGPDAVEPPDLAPIDPDLQPRVLRRVRIYRDPKPGQDDQPVPPIDAWRVLQRARARVLQEGGGPRARSVDDLGDALEALDGVGLDHVMTLDPYPRTNPYSRTNPYPRTNPYVNAPGAETYGEPGSGGRQVVDYIGAAPKATIDPAADAGGRRPLVAVLDTGCGRHTWLDPVVTRLSEPPTSIGITDPATDPEVHGDVLGPYDGYMDEAVGHGTFISGIIRQTCPDAEIVAVRVADGDGTIIEGQLIEALDGLLDWNDATGGRLDVINLSLGYYHETPTRTLFDRALSDLLTRARLSGCAVVCSAGNESTDRPAFPAALWAWKGADFTIADAGEGAPHLSVGALNPNGTMALFSNLGPWVRTYAPGASVLSTFPLLNGDVQPGTRDEEWGVVRETIDPDDFAAGFAVWSGTSFAAPFVSGALAKALVKSLAKGPVSVEKRVKDLRAAEKKILAANAKRGPRPA